MIEFIAEIGNNHNGSVERALQLVDAAKASGADTVKFQIRDLESVYGNALLESDSTELSVEYHLDLLKKYNLDQNQNCEIFDYCNLVGINYLATPFDLKSLEFLEGLGCGRIKISSADFTNISLLKAAVDKGFDLILSTGMTTTDDIKNIVAFLNSLSANFSLLHCNSAYPAPLWDLNMKFLERLKEFTPIVGYSGHERGYVPSLIAVSMGAKIVERHITLNKELEGPDHEASLLPSEFEEMIAHAKEVSACIGNGEERIPSQGELLNKEALGKTAYACRTLEVGKTLEVADLDFKSPAVGVSGVDLLPFIGRPIGTRIGVGEKITIEKLQGVSDDAPAAFEGVNFGRPIGVPLRFHDLEKISRVFSFCNFFEFHLSYNDLKYDLSTLSMDAQSMACYDYYFHVPELFAGSELIDLFTNDDNYFDRSIRNLESVVEIATLFCKQVSSSSGPKGYILNAGGFSTHANLSREARSVALGRFERALNNIGDLRYDLLIQNMAPYPWHFGGQRYQNFFVLPDDIANLCKRFGLRMCIDTSHMIMTCNKYDLDVDSYIAEVAPYTDYLHIADAVGVSGEGVQIGSGDGQFDKIIDSLSRHCQGVPFIPEIWQGHHNGGKPFYDAFCELKSCGLD